MLWIKKFFNFFFKGKETDFVSAPEAPNNEEIALKHLCTNLGCALLLCQLVERNLKQLAEVSLTDGKVEFEKLLHDKPDYRTLGRLIKAIRGKFSLEKGFDDTLSDYLIQRNLVVHNLTEQSFFATDDVNKLLDSYAYVRELRMTGKKLNDILSSSIIEIAINYKSPLCKKEIEDLLSLSDN